MYLVKQFVIKFYLLEDSEYRKIQLLISQDISQIIITEISVLLENVQELIFINSRVSEKSSLNPPATFTSFSLNEESYYFLNDSFHFTTYLYHPQNIFLFQFFPSQIKMFRVFTTQTEYGATKNSFVQHFLSFSCFT